VYSRWLMHLFGALIINTFAICHIELLRFFAVLVKYWTREKVVFLQMGSIVVQILLLFPTYLEPFYSSMPTHTAMFLESVFG
jgi:hypothetical protein